MNKSGVINVDGVWGNFFVSFEEAEAIARDLGAQSLELDEDGQVLLEWSNK